MTAYIVRRLIQALFTLLLVTAVVFLVMRLLPGDPLLLYVAEMQADTSELTPEAIADLRHQYGLDKPLAVQYISWLGGVLHGDFGTSIYYKEKVSTLLLERYPITIHLGVLAFILSTVLGILSGTIAALRRGKKADAILTPLTYIGITIPTFWFGVLLIYFFGLKLGWLPTQGYTSPFDDFWLSTKQVIMPVICLSVFGLAATARQMRSSMLEVIRQDYIRTAWSKGLRERDIVVIHAMKNSLIPVITLLGMAVRVIFGGSVLIETVFNIPGLGRLIVTSIFGQDYVVVQASTLVIAILIILSNLMVDLSYGWLDPRIRYS
jgi:peptide/nickel transport system permease protein